MGEQIEARTVFDDLNEALSAQMAKLQSVDPKDQESMQSCIDQTRAVTGLATSIIRNQQNAMDFMRMQQEMMGELSDKAIATPKMLKGRY